MTDLCILDRQKEGLKGVRAGDLLEIQKGVYGLCNVPLGCGVDVSDRCWFSWDLRKCG